MYIEIEEKSYYISIRDDETAISVLGRRDDAIHLAVSARLSQDELVAYLKRNDLRAVAEVDSTLTDDFITLALFDSAFTLIVQRGVYKPYIKGNSLYISKIPRTTAGRESLADTLLLQEIKQHIGFWEEKLAVLISDIGLRRLKKNYYTVSRQHQRLTFERSIVHRSRDFIAYLCANAVFDYLSLGDSVREELGYNYVTDWKQQQRILKHELQWLDDSILEKRGAV